jgi:peptide subunit release factor 1 (eRF1)
MTKNEIQEAVLAAAEAAATAAETTTATGAAAAEAATSAGATRATASARSTGAGRAKGGLRLHRQQAFALHLLARELAGAAHRFRFLTGLFLGGFFKMAAKLHFAENALALHLLFERLEGLVDVVIADENLHRVVFLLSHEGRIRDEKPCFQGFRVARV